MAPTPGRATVWLSPRSWSLRGDPGGWRSVPLCRSPPSWKLDGAPRDDHVLRIIMMRWIYQSRIIRWLTRRSKRARLRLETPTNGEEMPKSGEEMPQSGNDGPYPRLHVPVEEAADPSPSRSPTSKFAVAHIRNPSSHVERYDLYTVLEKATEARRQLTLETSLKTAMRDHLYFREAVQLQLLRWSDEDSVALPQSDPDHISRVFGTIGDTSRALLLLKSLQRPSTYRSCLVPVNERLEPLGAICGLLEVEEFILDKYITAKDIKAAFIFWVVDDVTEDTVAKLPRRVLRRRSGVVDCIATTAAASAGYSLAYETKITSATKLKYS